MATYFRGLPSIKLDAEMVSLARELVAKKAAPFKPEAYQDSYAIAMKELVDRKAKGQRMIARPTPDAPQGKVIDLLDALRSSLKKLPANSNVPPKPKARKSTSKS